MAETDVSNSSEQVPSSKYSSRLTCGLLAFIGGFAGLHTFYRTDKISSFRTVLSGCFLYFLVSYNYWYLYAVLVLINSFITLSIVFDKNVANQNVQGHASQLQTADDNDKLILITITVFALFLLVSATLSFVFSISMAIKLILVVAFIGLGALLINASGIKISFK
ncbi:MAG: hypothetical protein HXK40_02805 [Atopobium sp.]|nr:hypothetical protein [Atopobium sp.]